jgi:hypothetical protein
MTGTDLCVNKSQCVPVIFEPPCILFVSKGILNPSVTRLTELLLIKCLVLMTLYCDIIIMCSFQITVD